MLIVGKVRWFDAEKGFGFIETKVGPDVFVHFTAIQKRGYRSLEEGQRVCYQLAKGKHGPMALNVTPL